MILGPINGIDCLAFVIFLIPQLLYQVAFDELLAVLVKMIPFLGGLAYRSSTTSILTVSASFSTPIPAYT